MKIALVGAGAFGEKHLESITAIDGAEVASVISLEADHAAAVAAKYGAPHSGTKLEDALSLPEVDAVILCTPTQMHAAQAIACMEAGKHVQVEIPAADNWADAEAVLKKQQETGLVCMVGHTRRFNPSHQWVKNQIDAGALTIQAMDVETFFFRRKNINAKGEARNWVDHLLWHHAAHTVDLFQYMTGSPVVRANVLQGPKHPELGIAMDMSIQMKTEAGQILTLALSFNNEGPLGTFFRYIGDKGTYLARYDDLYTGNEEKIDVSNMAVSLNGIELQDREFISAIQENRTPNAAIQNVFPCYKVLGELAAQLETQDGWS